MADITRTILDEHEWFRRAFAELDEASDESDLAVLWKRLEGRLEVHALAEEAIFYPILMKVGDDAVDETDDAIVDHDEIRAASHRTRDEAVGSDAWWEAVRDARSANSDHMAEEERGALADLQLNVDPARRNELGLTFAVFLARRTAIDVSRSNDGPDPDEYIEKHRPNA